jgi:hypothetical protein
MLQLYAPAWKTPPASTMSLKVLPPSVEISSTPPS